MMRIHRLNRNNVSRLAAPAIAVLVLLSLAGCSGGYADSPEEAAKKYFDAKHGGDISALKKVWKVNDDPERADTIIRAEVAASRTGDRFFRKLHRTYAREIEDQVMKGDFFVHSQTGRKPSSKDIEKGIENAFPGSSAGRRLFTSGENETSEEANSSRLTTTVRNGGMLYLNEYDGHWYVEHPYVAVGREWTDTDRRLQEGTAEVFDEMIDEIGRDGNSLDDVMRKLNQRLRRMAAEASRSRLLEGTKEGTKGGRSD